MNNPKISISRQNKTFAIFDGFDLIGRFEKYTSEEEAIKTASFRIATATNKVPEIVYPSVTKIRMSS